MYVIIPTTESKFSNNECHLHCSLASSARPIQQLHHSNFESYSQKLIFQDQVKIFNSWQFCSEKGYEIDIKRPMHLVNR